MKISAIRNSLEKFEGLTILIIGDVMLDSYIWGNVTRISPEAPVPVVIQSGTENRLGGAANVALNLHSLGAVPVMCSIIGTDENGSAFKELIRKLGLPEEGLIETDKRITTSKTRIFAGHQQMLRVDKETDQFIEEELENQLWLRIRDAVERKNIAAIIFQDYDKGVITPDLIEKVIVLANERHIPTLVDPKRRNFAHYRNATLFKPNFKELSEGLNLEMDKNDFTVIHDAAHSLLVQYGFRMVMITLSEQGMLISMDNEFMVVPTQAREIADVSGAGDTVIAMASLCLAAKMETADMAYLTNLAAGLVCEKAGVVPVEKQWLIEFNSKMG